MSPKPKPGPFFWVVCDEWSAGPFKTEEVALRKLDEIVAFGACTLPHRVETTRVEGRRPRTRFTSYRTRS
jgi:hypothetical protein